MTETSADNSRVYPKCTNRDRDRHADTRAGAHASPGRERKVSLNLSNTCDRGGSESCFLPVREEGGGREMERGRTEDGNRSRGWERQIGGSGGGYSSIQRRAHTYKSRLDMDACPHSSRHYLSLPFPTPLQPCVSEREYLYVCVCVCVCNTVIEIIVFHKKHGGE